MENTGKVIFGTTVTILNVDTDEETTYRIVGDDEADIKKNRISVNSPIARGLIGKEIDDMVTIQTPAGSVEVEIIEVEYIWYTANQWRSPLVWFNTKYTTKTNSSFTTL